MLIKKVRSVGRGAWFGALAGLAGGLVLAMPGGPAPAGVVQALMAGAHGPTSAPPAGDGPTTTITRPEPTTTLPPHEPTTTASDHGKTPPGVEPSTTSTTSAPSPSDQGGAPAGGTTTTCDGTITSFHVTVVDGGRALRLEVAVTGQVGWMSAYAHGFGGAALTPVPGGFAGTITGTGPVAPGTEVVVASCHNRVRASTKVGGDGGTTPAAAPGDSGSTTTTTAAPSETTGCTTAIITSVSARLRGGGSAVTVYVLVTGTLGSMSGEVNGFGVIALHTAPGGFEGTLTVNGSIPVGTEVVVGACGGKVRATASVVAA